MHKQGLPELEFWSETRVSYKHRLYQEAVKRAFEAQDYHVVTEKAVTGGGFVDVAAYPKGPAHKPTAIEITLSTRNAMKNISKAFNEFQKVIVVYEDNDVKNRVAEQAYLGLKLEQLEQVEYKEIDEYLNHLD